MSSWLSLLFVILMGIAIGIIIGYPSLRIKGIYLALTTLGFSEIVRILVTNLMDLTGGPSGVRAIPGFTFFGLQINSAHSYLFLFMAILFVLLVLTVYITNSKWGRAIKAVANNELAVEACGIRLSKMCIRDRYVYRFSFENQQEISMDDRGTLYTQRGGYTMTGDISGVLDLLNGWF